MLLKLYEDAIRAKAQNKKKKGRRNSGKSPVTQDQPTDPDTEAVPDGHKKFQYAWYGKSSKPPFMS